METRCIARQLLHAQRRIRPSRKALPSRQGQSISQSCPRAFTSTHTAQSIPLNTPEELTGDKASVPRWRQTPASMKVPFQVRRPADQPAFICNEDPDKLHAFYNRFLGQDGWKMLTEDTRWLAITHKSFDQGRRGFNARLSYLGKRNVELQWSLWLVSKPAIQVNYIGDAIRTPFEDATLMGIDRLTMAAKENFLSVGRVANIARQYGMQEVLRWRPTSTTGERFLGEETAMAQAIYAIVGAVALERGGADANRLVMQRILKPTKSSAP